MTEAIDLAVTTLPPPPPETAGNIIEINSLTKWYPAPRANRRLFGSRSSNRTLVLNKLSMYVPQGSVYGFVGPSGAGKTTTLRTLATLEKPDGGTVGVAGVDVKSRPSAVRRQISYMPDGFGLYDGLTVLEYLEFFGACFRIPRRHRRQLCDELLELVELTEFRDAAATSLSRGMKQRLGIARCLVHDPDILLLDDPASGMDPRARLELFEILRGLSGMGKTIVLTSAVLYELSEVCTDIGVIQQGFMIAEGPVEQVIHQFSIQARSAGNATDANSSSDAGHGPIGLEDVFFGLTEPVGVDA